MLSQPDNPFRPPQQANDSATLDADTEFLISDSCVLCSDKVTLPQVCIHSGVTEGVVKKSAVLTYIPRLLYIPSVIFVVFAASPVIETVNAVLFGGASFVTTQTVSYAITISLAVSFVVLCRLTKRTMKCTWWVHPKARTWLSALVGRQMPVYAGPHRGLNLLVGLSPEFLQRVQQMIDEAAERKAERP